MRMTTALVLAFGIAMILPAGEAAAKSHKKPKNKQCTATNLLGQKSTFKCKGGETCCFDYGLNKGVCKKASEACL